MSRPTAAYLSERARRNRESWNRNIDDHGGDSPWRMGEPDTAKPKKPPRPRQASIPEARVLKGCMDILESHPSVALWWRQNTGAITKGTRHIKFSFKGASDLMAVLRPSGRFLAVECKATRKTATTDQKAFLDNVLEAGAFSLCVDDPQQLIDYLRMV